MGEERQMPRVSVVIPTYNRAALLKQAIDSVLAQTYTDYEIIIVDDGSTDEMADLVDRYVAGPGRVRYYYQNNRGRSAARNAGIRLAVGEFIAFLDSDDLFLPRKLEMQVAALSNQPEYGMAFSNAISIDERGNVLSSGPLFRAQLSGMIYPELLFIRGTMIMTPTVMIRARILNQVGSFDENLSMCEDLDLWRRIARMCPVLQIQSPLSAVRYRINEKWDCRALLKARLDFYAKAIAEDQDLESIRTRLYAEAYFHYGFTEVLQNRRADQGFQWLLESARLAPFQFCKFSARYMARYALVAMSGLARLQRTLPRRRNEQ